MDALRQWMESDLDVIMVGARERDDGGYNKEPHKELM